jgi:hypothetical protein
MDDLQDIGVYGHAIISSLRTSSRIRQLEAREDGGGCRRANDSFLTGHRDQF